MATSSSSSYDDEFRRMFSLLDHRGSGKLEITGFRLFLESLPEEEEHILSFLEAEELFQSHDADKSGDIDIDEFQGLCAELERKVGMSVVAMAKHFTEKQYEKLFRLVDDTGNRDMTVNAFELQTFLDVVVGSGLKLSESSRGKSKDVSALIKYEIARSSAENDDDFDSGALVVSSTMGSVPASTSSHLRSSHSDGAFGHRSVSPLAASSAHVLNFKQFCSVVGELIEGHSISRVVAVFQDTTRKCRARRNTALQRFGRQGGDGSAASTATSAAPTTSAMAPATAGGGATEGTTVPNTTVSRVEHNILREKLEGLRAELAMEKSEHFETKAKLNELADLPPPPPPSDETEQQELSALRKENALLKKRIQELETSKATSAAPVPGTNSFKTGGKEGVRSSDTAFLLGGLEEEEAAAVTHLLSTLSGLSLPDILVTPPSSSTEEGDESEGFQLKSKSVVDDTSSTSSSDSDEDDDEVGSPQRRVGTHLPKMEATANDPIAFSFNLQDQLRSEAMMLNIASPFASAPKDGSAFDNDSDKQRLTAVASVPSREVEEHHVNRMLGWAQSLGALAAKLEQQYTVLEHFFERITMPYQVMVQLQFSALKDLERLAQLRLARIGSVAATMMGIPSDEEDDIMSSLEVFLDSMQLKRHSLQPKVAVCDDALRDNLLVDLAKFRQQVLMFLEQYEWLRHQAARLHYYNHCGGITEVEASFDTDEFIPSSLPTTLSSALRHMDRHVTVLTALSETLFLQVGSRGKTDAEKLVKAAVKESNNSNASLLRQAAVATSRLAPAVSSDLKRSVALMEERITAADLWQPSLAHIQSVLRLLRGAADTMTTEVRAAPRLAGVDVDTKIEGMPEEEDSIDLHRPTPRRHQDPSGLVDDRLAAAPPMVESGTQATAPPPPPMSAVHCQTEVMWQPLHDPTDPLTNPTTTSSAAAGDNNKGGQGSTTRSSSSPQQGGGGGGGGDSSATSTMMGRDASPQDAIDAVRTAERLQATTDQLLPHQLKDDTFTTSLRKELFKEILENHRAEFLSLDATSSPSPSARRHRQEEDRGGDTNNNVTTTSTSDAVAGTAFMSGVDGADVVVALRQYVRQLEEKAGSLSAQLETGMAREAEMAKLVDNYHGKLMEIGTTNPTSAISLRTQLENARRHAALLERRCDQLEDENVELIRQGAGRGGAPAPTTTPPPPSLLPAVHNIGTPSPKNSFGLLRSP